MSWPLKDDCRIAEFQQQVEFQPRRLDEPDRRLPREADGAASALAFVAAGFGLAAVSEPLRRIPAKDVIFRDLAPKDRKDRAWVPVGAAWKPDGVTAIVASQFVDVLAQTCAGGNGESRATGIKAK